MISIVERIVSSNVDGRVLIPVIIALIPFLIGQAKDCLETYKRILREEGEATSN